MLAMIKRINYTNLLTEVLSIVIGVLLALAANDWNNNRLDNIKLKLAFANVTTELQQNEKLLVSIAENNARVLKSIEQQNQEQQGKFVPGLQLRDTAWQTFMSSGLSNAAEIHVLQSLHDHYALLNVYKSLSYQTVQSILSTRALLEVTAKKEPTFEDSIRLLVTLEQALLVSNKYTQEVLVNSRT
jgi:hypothetical protein